MSEAGAVLKGIFSKALEYGSVAERDRYLAGACGGDAALRTEVEALLDAFGKAGDFLEAPSSPPEQPLVGEPGTVIGQYKLIEQIGEGGFGAVYLAEQMEPVRRQVALKILKAGMDTRQVVSRFEAER